MAKSISDGIFELTGKKATSAEVQKLLAIASVMGIKPNDPMIMLYMVFEHYNSLFSTAPDRIKDAVDGAAQNAATNAQTAVNIAVAGLIPSINKAVTSATKQCMVIVQIGSSMITVFAGFVILGLVFVLGLMYGSGVQNAMHNDKLNISRVWQYLGIGAFGGIATIGFFIIMTLYIENEEKKVFGFFGGFMGFILTATLIYMIIHIN